MKLEESDEEEYKNLEYDAFWDEHLKFQGEHMKAAEIFFNSSILDGSPFTISSSCESSVVDFVYLFIFSLFLLYLYLYLYLVGIYLTLIKI